MERADLGSMDRVYRGRRMNVYDPHSLEACGAEGCGGRCLPGRKLCEKCLNELLAIPPRHRKTTADLMNEGTGHRHSYDPEIETEGPRE